MNKVIVTGGMGYIGSHTIVELLANGYTPIIFDNLSNSSTNVLKGLKEITGHDTFFEKVELTNPTETRAAFESHKDAVGVIHFAAFKAVGESVEKPLLYYNNNISSLVNVLESITEFDIKNIIFSSSCTVYGQADELPVTEDTPLQKASSPYGQTKQIGEQILKDFLSARPEHTGISLRYFNPIGAHESGLIGELPNGIPNNLLPFITQTAKGKREVLNVFGGDYKTNDGTAIRDYIHVVDLAKAHVQALSRIQMNINVDNYEIFNLGTGIGYSVLDVINAFEASTGVKVNYQIVDRRKGDIESIYADTKKANDVLGWKAKSTLKDMTSTAWKWEMNSEKS